MRASRHSKHRTLHRRPPAKLDSVRNDINVTPLVDVCLVLLIIFMVILPMLERGKDIPGLPKTAHHLDGKDNNEPIVAIDEAGRIFVDKTDVKNVKGMKAAVKD